MLVNNLGGRLFSKLQLNQSYTFRGYSCCFFFVFFLVHHHFMIHTARTVTVTIMPDTNVCVEQMRKLGFGHFVGVDGSEAMLDKARESGLYQDLKHCLLGEEPLPVQWAGTFDVVLIVGALSVGQVPVSVIRDMCKATKPGGCICMTTRSNHDNLEYKAALESELKKMVLENYVLHIKKIVFDAHHTRSSCSSNVFQKSRR
uniref:Methyltransferase like 27 n=1 Tax=Fundulus heteroclitus TaxID=8078 RepID=A0A3Q2Q9X8_FUNHE